MSDGTTLRPRWGKGITIVVAALCGLGLGTLIFTGDASQILHYSWGLVLLPYLTWLAFWSPSVTIADDGVVVRNLIREHRIPWPRIERVETRYALTLYTDARKITAWSAPAPNRYAGSNLSKPDLAGLPESTYGAGGSVGAGDNPSSESGLAALYVRRRWDRMRELGELELGRDTPAVATQILWPQLIVGAVLLVATLVGWTV